jgi:DNA-binding FadR family transcriptional regulator
MGLKYDIFQTMAAESPSSRIRTSSADEDRLSDGVTGLDLATFTPNQVLRPRQQVESQLRRAILDGTFAQGAKLPTEARLATSFGVSRTTVREALRTLADDGLIFKTPGATGGSFVKAVDHHVLSDQLGQSVETTLKLGSVTYQELHNVRRMIEPPAAELAALHRTDKHVAELQICLDRQRHVNVADADVPDLDIEFHTILADAASNRLLAALLTALHRVARPVQYLNMSAEDGREIVRQHAAIIKAVAEGAPVTAGEAMASHLDFILALPTRVAPGDHLS